MSLICNDRHCKLKLKEYVFHRCLNCRFTWPLCFLQIQNIPVTAMISRVPVTAEITTNGIQGPGNGRHEVKHAEVCVVGHGGCEGVRGTDVVAPKERQSLVWVNVSVWFTKKSKQIKKDGDQLNKQIYYYAVSENVILKWPNERLIKSISKIVQ